MWGGRFGSGINVALPQIEFISSHRCALLWLGMVATSAQLVEMPAVGSAPFLRWAGSKRKLLPKLTPYWGEGFVRYLEPFAGSSALFFAIQPTQAVLSDTNAELIESLEEVRNAPSEVHRLVSSMKHTKAEYYRVRKQDRAALDSRGRAARFIYLNRYCFNGLYRTNLAGNFNVPFASSGTGGVPPLEVFLENARLLRNAELICGDFDTVVREHVRAGDFVYLDPPYAVANRRIFRQYGPHTFGLDDLDKLKLLLEYIDGCGASFLLSYADCKESRALGVSWRHHRVFTQRNIAGFQMHRRRAAETIITNIDADLRRV
jgi:DNA adenine methylase